jgi:hypothetical protein
MDDHERPAKQGRPQDGGGQAAILKRSEKRLVIYMVKTKVK